MAVSYGAIGVRSYKQAVATTDTVTPALPTGSGAGLLVVFASGLQTGTTFSSNNGLTQSRKHDRIGILEKVVTDLSLESAPTITFGSIVVGDQIAAMCLWFPGGTSSKDWNDATGGAVTTMTPATLTVSDAGSCGVVFGHQPNDKAGASFTANSWTQREYSTSTVGSDATHYVATQDSLTTGAKTMPSWSWTGTLEWRSISFSVPPATSSQAITGALFTNSQTFYGATVGRGAVSIDGALLTNGQTFYQATVAPGAVDIAGALYTNPQTFYGATVSQASASQDITAALFTNVQSFFEASVSVGAVDITAELFTNEQVFYGATIDLPDTRSDRGDGVGSAVTTSRRAKRRRASETRNANYLQAQEARAAQPAATETPEPPQPKKQRKPAAEPVQPEPPAQVIQSAPVPQTDYADRSAEQAAVIALIAAQEDDEDEIEVLMLLSAA